MGTKAADMLYDTIKAFFKKKTSSYDSVATVTRIEGNTAWVHIPGGVPETPVKLTVSARPGDLVQIRVGGSKAWITGNASAPPTDDTVAKEAVKGVGIIRKSVKAVGDAVDKVGRIAGNTAQYFWHVEEGTDTGVHITEKPKDEFLEDPDNGGGNMLARSNGIAIRDGLTELATFGADGAQVGKDDDSNVQILPNAIKMIKDGLECVSFSLPTDSATMVDRDVTFIDDWESPLTTGQSFVIGDSEADYDYVELYWYAEGLSFFRFPITLTQQGGYNASDGATYFYYSYSQTNGWTVYSNGNRAFFEREYVWICYYKNIKSAPSYVGCYPDKTDATVMFGVGNGTPDNPSNAMTVNWLGNLSCQSMDSGKYEGTSVPAGNYADFSISFKHSFSAAPIVTVSFKANTPSSAASMGNVSMTVFDVSTTGFKVRVYNNATAARTPHINWIAILS